MGGLLNKSLGIDKTKITESEEEKYRKILKKANSDEYDISYLFVLHCRGLNLQKKSSKGCAKWMFVP